MFKKMFIFTVILSMLFCGVSAFAGEYTVADAEDVWNRPHKYLNKKIAIAGFITNGKFVDCGENTYYKFNFVLYDENGNQETFPLNPFRACVMVNYTEHSNFADRIYEGALDKLGYTKGCLTKATREQKTCFMVDYVIEINKWFPAELK